MRLYETNYQNYETQNVEFSVKRKKIRGFDLTIVGETANCKTLLARLFFYLISKGNFEIYYVTEDTTGKIIHTSYVTGKSIKFRFMKSGDIHIGPCHTSSAYRGKGIYRNVLRFINNEKRESCQKAYMIVEEANTSSIKGIEAAGFRHTGSVRKSKICKVYRRISDG